MKQFDELPIEIQNRMLDCQEEQGNPRNPDVFRRYLKESKFSKGFAWQFTSEGLDVWNEVLVNNNYAPFFKIHPSNGWENREIERLNKWLDDARLIIEGKQKTIDAMSLSAQRTEANHQAYIAKIKGENEALRNENKFLRELLTKQLNILPVSNSVCPDCNGDGQTYGVMGFSTCKLCNGNG